MTIKAILWDMDGTLLNSEPVHEIAFEEAIAALGLEVPPETHASLLGASMMGVHRKLVEVTGVALPLETWRDTKWASYERHADSITPLPGIQAIIEDLHARGVPMAVVSNSIRAEVDLNLRVTGMAHYFPLTVSSNDVTHGKPAPDPYLLAAQQLGIAPADCLVIEDSVTGATAGLAAGMTTIFHPETDALVERCPQGAVLLRPKGDLSGLLANYLG